MSRVSHRAKAGHFINEQPVHTHTYTNTHTRTQTVYTPDTKDGVGLVTIAMDPATFLLKLNLKV